MEIINNKAIFEKIDCATKDCTICTKYKTIYNFAKSKNIFNIILDYNLVSFISSFGLNHLLTISKNLKLNNGKLIITNLNPNLINIFEFSGMAKFNILYITKNLEEALKLINN